MPSIWDELMAALQLRESSNNPNALSDDGAVGLFGIMPEDAMTPLRKGVPSVFDAARNLGFDVSSETLDESKRLLRDPDINRAIAEPYLRELMAKYNWDIDKALTAYNAGPKKLDGILAQGLGFDALDKEEQRTYAADMARDYQSLHGKPMPTNSVLVSPRPRMRPMRGM